MDMEPPSPINKWVDKYVNDLLATGYSGQQVLNDAVATIITMTAEDILDPRRLRVEVPNVGGLGVSLRYCPPMDE